MPLTSHDSAPTGKACEVCGSTGCRRFHEPLWPSNYPFLPGGYDVSKPKPDLETEEPVNDGATVRRPTADEYLGKKRSPRPRTGRRARRRGEDRALRPAEDREPDR